MNQDLTSFFGKFKTLFNYLFFHKGFLAGGPAPAGAFLSTNKNISRPNLQLHFLPLSLNKPGIISNIHGYTFNISLSRPKSRGEINVVSSDPTSHPLIKANYLSHIQDKKNLIEGIKITRKIANSNTFKKHNSIEIQPGSECVSDFELLISSIRSLPIKF